MLMQDTSAVWEAWETIVTYALEVAASCFSRCFFPHVR